MQTFRVARVVIVGFLAFPVVVVLSASAAVAGDWLQFRGPGGRGVAADQGLPVQWSADRNIVGKTDLPGPGSSSPIVVGNQIFLTCYSGFGVPGSTGEMTALKRHLVCIDGAGGQIHWTRDATASLPEEEYEGFQALHGYASSTPVSDGEHVYVFFGKSGVFAFDLSGHQLWRSSVGTRTHNWGSGTSPVLLNNLVIVNAAVESRSLVALKTSDGQEAWRTAGIVQSWNTPLLVDAAGRHELIVSVQGRLRAFDPQTGKELWYCDGIDDYVVPSVTAQDGVVYVIGARAGRAAAVRAGGSGDVTESHVLWRLNRGSNVSSPVYHEGHLYWAHESRGIVFCVDVTKGKIVYEQRLEPTPDRIYASPLLAGGKLYYVSRTRGTYVVDAKPTFKLVAHNVIATDSSVFNASPVPHNGHLLLRSDRALYRIGTNN